MGRGIESLFGTGMPEKPKPRRAVGGVDLLLGTPEMQQTAPGVESRDSGYFGTETSATRLPKGSTRNPLADEPYWPGKYDGWEQPAPEPERRGIPASTMFSRELQLPNGRSIPRQSGQPRELGASLSASRRPVASRGGAPALRPDSTDYRNRNLHERVSDVLTPDGSRGVMDRAGGNIAGMVGDVSAGARAGFEHVKRGGNPADLGWETLDAAAGGPTARRQEFARLTEEERQKHLLWNKHGLNVGGYIRSVTGQTAGEPGGLHAVGWNPQREGMDPASYLANVASEAFGRYVTAGQAFHRGFTPAFAAENVFDLGEALTGMSMQEVVARTVNGRLGKMYVRPWYSDADRRRVEAHNEQWDIGADARREKSRQAWKRLGITYADLVAFAPKVAKEFSEDPVGLLLERPFDIIAALHMTKSAAEHGRRGAAMLEQQQREARLRRDYERTAADGTPVPPIRDSRPAGEPTAAERLARRTQQATQGIERGVDQILSVGPTAAGRASAAIWRARQALDASRTAMGGPPQAMPNRGQVDVAAGVSGASPRYPRRIGETAPAVSSLENGAVLEGPDGLRATIHRNDGVSSLHIENPDAKTDHLIGTEDPVESQLGNGARLLSPTKGEGTLERTGAKTELVYDSGERILVRDGQLLRNHSVVDGGVLSDRVELSQDGILRDWKVVSNPSENVMSEPLVDSTTEPGMPLPSLASARHRSLSSQIRAEDARGVPDAQPLTVGNNGEVPGFPYRGGRRASLSQATADMLAEIGAPDPPFGLKPGETPSRQQRASQEWQQYIRGLQEAVHLNSETVATRAAEVQHSSGVQPQVAAAGDAVERANSLARQRQSDLNASPDEVDLYVVVPESEAARLHGGDVSFIEGQHTERTTTDPRVARKMQRAANLERRRGGEPELSSEEVQRRERLIDQTIQDPAQRQKMKDDLRKAWRDGRPEKHVVIVLRTGRAAAEAFSGGKLGRGFFRMGDPVRVTEWRGPRVRGDVSPRFLGTVDLTDLGRVKGLEKYSGKPELSTRGAVERAAGAAVRFFDRFERRTVPHEVARRTLRFVRARNRFVDAALLNLDREIQDFVGPRALEAGWGNEAGRIFRAAQNWMYGERNLFTRELPRLLYGMSEAEQQEFVDWAHGKDQRKADSLPPKLRDAVLWWTGLSEQMRHAALTSGELMRTTEWMRRYQRLRIERKGIEWEREMQLQRMRERNDPRIKQALEEVEGQLRAQDKPGSQQTLFQSGRRKGKRARARANRAEREANLRADEARASERNADAAAMEEARRAGLEKSGDEDLAFKALEEMGRAAMRKASGRIQARLSLAARRGAEEMAAARMEASREAARLSPLDADYERTYRLTRGGEWWRTQVLAAQEEVQRTEGIRPPFNKEQAHMAALLMDMHARAWGIHEGKHADSYYTENLYGVTAGWAKPGDPSYTGGQRALFQRGTKSPFSYESRLQDAINSLTLRDVIGKEAATSDEENAHITADEVDRAIKKLASKFHSAELEATAIPEFMGSVNKVREYATDLVKTLRWNETDEGGNYTPFEGGIHAEDVERINNFMTRIRGAVTRSDVNNPLGSIMNVIAATEQAHPKIPKAALEAAAKVALYSAAFGKGWKATQNGYVPKLSFEGGRVLINPPPQGVTLSMLKRWTEMARPKVQDLYLDPAGDFTAETTADNNNSYQRFELSQRSAINAYENIQRALETPATGAAAPDHTNPPLPFDHAPLRQIDGMLFRSFRPLVEYVISDAGTERWYDSVDFGLWVHGHAAAHLDAFAAERPENLAPRNQALYTAIKSAYRDISHYRGEQLDRNPAALDFITRQFVGVVMRHFTVQIAKLRDAGSRRFALPENHPAILLDNIEGGPDGYLEGMVSIIAGFHVGGAEEGIFPADQLPRTLEDVRSSLRSFRESLRAYAAQEAARINAIVDSREHPAVALARQFQSAQTDMQAHTNYGTHQGAPLPPGEPSWALVGGTAQTERGSQFMRRNWMGGKAKLVADLERLAPDFGGLLQAIRESAGGPIHGEPHAKNAKRFEVRYAFKRAFTEFSSGHWDSYGQDIFSHVRTSIHYTREGTPFLLVQELQADPLQKQGGVPFIGSKEFEPLSVRMEELNLSSHDAYSKLAEEGSRLTGSEYAPYEGTPDLYDLRGLYNEIQRDLAKKGEAFGLDPTRPGMTDAEVMARLTALGEAASAREALGALEAAKTGLLQRFGEAAAKIQKNENDIEEARVALGKMYDNDFRADFPLDKDRAYEDHQVYRLLSEAYRNGMPGVAWMAGAHQAHRNQQHLSEAARIETLFISNPGLDDLRTGKTPRGKFNLRTGRAPIGSGGKTHESGVDVEKLARMIESDRARLGAPLAYENAGVAARKFAAEAAAKWSGSTIGGALDMPDQRLADFEAHLEAKYGSNWRERVQPRTDAGARQEPSPRQVIAKMREGMLSKGKQWTDADEARQQQAMEKRFKRPWSELAKIPDAPEVRRPAEEELWAKESNDEAIQLFWLRKQAEEFEPLKRDASMDRSDTRVLAEQILKDAQEYWREHGEYNRDGDPVEFPVDLSKEPYNRITHIGGAGLKDYYDKQMANRIISLTKKLLLDNGAPKEAVESVRVEMQPFDVTNYAGETGRIIRNIQSAIGETEQYHVVHNYTASELLGSPLTNARELGRRLEHMGYMDVQAAIDAVERGTYIGELANRLRLAGAVELTSYPRLNSPTTPTVASKVYAEFPVIRWGYGLTQYLGKAPLMQRSGAEVKRPGYVKGAVEFLNDGRAVMRMFGATDVTTLVHETAHIMRKFLPEKLLKHAEHIYGVRGGVWTIPQEELFATNFERYMMEGRSPDRAMAAVFQKYAGWLSAIYSEATADQRMGRVTAPVRRLFADMLGMSPESERVGVQGHEPFELPVRFRHGDAMRSARERFAMTLDEASKRTEIPVEEIDAYERGTADLSDADIARLAVAYHMDADVVIHEKHNPRPQPSYSRWPTYDLWEERETGTRGDAPPASEAWPEENDVPMFSEQPEPARPSAYEEGLAELRSKIAERERPVSPKQGESWVDSGGILRDEKGPLFQRGQAKTTRELVERFPAWSAHRALMDETLKLSEELQALGREAPLFFPAIKQVRPSDFLAPWSYLRRTKNQRMKHSTGDLIASNGYVKDPAKVAAAWYSQRLKYETYLKVLRDIAASPDIPSRVYDGKSPIGENEVLLPIDAIQAAMRSQMMMERGLSANIDRLGMVDESISATLRPLVAKAEFERIAHAIGNGKVLVIPKVVAERLKNEYSGAPKWVRLLIDKPTQYWVWATLFLRPAWVVNNVVSDAIVSLLSGVGPKEYHEALKEQFIAVTPAEFRTQTQAFQFGAQQPHLGRAAETELGKMYSWLEDSPPGQLLGAAADLMRSTNERMSDFFRRATYITYAKRQARENYLRRTNDSFYRAYGALREMDRITADPKQVEKVIAKVNYWMNDYAALSPFERSVFRRFAPFYGFMRWQLQLAATLPVKYPGRTLLMSALSQAYHDDHQSDEARLPEYLRGNGLVFTGATVTSPRTGRTLEVWLSTQGWNPFILGGFDAAGDAKDLGDIEKLVTNQLGPIPQYAVQALTRRNRNGQAFTEPGTVQVNGKFYRRLEDVRGYGGKVIRAYPEQGIAEVNPPIPSPAEHYAGSFPQVSLARNLMNPEAGYSAAPFSLESAKGSNTATERARLLEVMRYFGAGSFILVDTQQGRAWPLSRSTMRSTLRKLAEQEATRKGNR